MGECWRKRCDFFVEPVSKREVSESRRERSRKRLIKTVTKTQVSEFGGMWKRKGEVCVPKEMPRVVPFGICGKAIKAKSLCYCGCNSLEC